MARRIFNFRDHMPEGEPMQVSEADLQAYAREAELLKSCKTEAEAEALMREFNQSQIISDFDDDLDIGAISDALR